MKLVKMFKVLTAYEFFFI